MAEWYVANQFILGKARLAVLDEVSRAAGGYRVRLKISSDFGRERPLNGPGQQHRIVPAYLRAVALAPPKVGELALPIFTGLSSIEFRDGERLVDAEATFEAILSRAAIDDIERFRDGGALRFRYVVKFDHFATVAHSMAHQGRCQHVWLVDVDLQKWTRGLVAAKYHEDFLGSVPLHRTDSSEVSRAHEYLLSACEQRDVGHFRDAIVHCRHALELIKPLKLGLNASANAQAAFKALRDLQNKESDTLADRFSILHAGLTVVASVGAHVNNSSNDVTRDDVNALLVSTSALLGLVPCRLEASDA